MIYFVFFGSVRKLRPVGYRNLLACHTLNSVFLEILTAQQGGSSIHLRHRFGVNSLIEEENKYAKIIPTKL